MKSIVKRFWLAIVLAAGIVGLPAEAHATLVLNLDGFTGAPGGGITCVDDTACDQSSSTPNLITYVGTVGNFLLNVEVGVSNAPSGDPANLHMSTTLLATGAETLALTLSDLFSPTGAGDLVFSSTGNGVGGIPAGSTFTGTGAKVNDQFVPYVTTPECSYSLALPTAGGNFPGCLETVGHDALAAYFMVLSQTIHVTGATGFFSINTSATNTSGEGTTEVPEPAALGLFGMGLTGVGMAIRRRRRQQAARSDS